MRAWPSPTSAGRDAPRLGPAAAGREERGGAMDGGAELAPRIAILPPRRRASCLCPAPFDARLDVAARRWQIAFASAKAVTGTSRRVKRTSESGTVEARPPPARRTSPPSRRPNGRDALRVGPAGGPP